MAYEIELDPCKACMIRYKDEECNVSNINHCVYETAAAFSGLLAVNPALKNKITENCQNCVANVLKTMPPLGFTSCDKKINPPLITYQVPHYVPGLINEGYNVEDARKQCKIMCNFKGQRNSAVCEINCDTDANAIVSLTPKKEIDLSCNDNFFCMQKIEGLQPCKPQQCGGISFDIPESVSIECNNNLKCTPETKCEQNFLTTQDKYFKSCIDITPTCDKCSTENFQQPKTTKENFDMSTDKKNPFNIIFGIIIFGIIIFGVFYIAMS